MPEKIIGIDLGTTSSISALDKIPLRPCMDCRSLIK